MTVQSLIAGCLLALAVLAVAPLVGPLGERSPRVPVTDETAGSSPAGVATYTRPAHEDLLSGEACIPLAELLRNRVPLAIHSFSRSVACE